MSDTAAAQTVQNAPVVATPGGEGQKTGAADAKPARQFDNAFDRVLAELNEQHGGSAEEFASLGDIADQVQEREQKEAGERRAAREERLGAQVSKEKAPAPPPPVGEEGAEPPAGPEQPKFETYKVDGKEVKLTPEQAKRFTQKGIYYEKQGVEIARMQQTLQQQLQQVQTQAQQQKALLDALMTDPGAVLERLHGPDAFKKIEPWAGQQVVREMEYEKNPQLRQQHEWERRAQAAEQERDNLRRQMQDQHLQAESAKLSQQYQDTISQALEQEGVWKSDVTARDMAAEMKRALRKGIEHTPQQLAQIVREDNINRTRTAVGTLAGQIEKAQQVNDIGAVQKLGAQLVDMLGEPVIYAIAKYHLARIRSAQPNGGNTPRPTVEQPRVNQQSKQPGWGKNGRPYMSEDEYALMRQKIIRGEMEPPPGW